MTPNKRSQLNGRLPPVLERFQANPILKPDSAHWWETKAVFNPAAIYEGGKVHILYRALGDSDNSLLGYASSLDGFHIYERLDRPAYVPRESFEGVSSLPRTKSGQASPYESGGGGLGGCEDPRLTRIEDRVYLTYVAYDGYSAPRVALSSIHIDDFLNKNWNWKKPVLISPPGIVDKNACILPEKINGKYVIFHRIFPHILIDFVDDLDFDGKTRWLEGHFKIPVKDSSWDSRKVAAGPPPLRTKEGWLFIYHAIDEKDDLRYKIGAMLLDIKEPTRVLARTARPILEPLADYENEGLKSGVVYPCGAVVLNGRLFVYYGGADMVVCVATANISEFMKQLSYESEAVEVSMPVNPPPDVNIRTEEHIQGFCVKCHKKFEIKNPRHIIMKNLRHAIQGICPRCGTKIFRLGRG
ncbi:MAG: DUF5679 domain-containing protein [Dehalococcoidales bacterium]|nr:DUF5679 domain-containing protein [Dehalococcoidales bacterium]